MLRIRNWDKHFETNETRKLKRLLWVKIPNQQDSLAYRLIASMPDGPAIFAAWVLIVQVASKQEKRGNLPLSPGELGIVTGFPADIFKRAIEVLKMPQIEWIEGNPDVPGEYPDTPGKSPETPPVDGREGMEENGMETPTNFSAWTKALKAAFDFNPTSMVDTRNLTSAVEGFQAKGTIEEMQKMVIRAKALYQPHMVTFKSVLNNWDSLKVALPPKKKIEGALS